MPWSGMGHEQEEEEQRRRRKGQPRPSEVSLEMVEEEEGADLDAGCQCRRTRHKTTADDSRPRLVTSGLIGLMKTVKPSDRVLTSRTSVGNRRSVLFRKFAGVRSLKEGSSRSVLSSGGGTVSSNSARSRCSFVSEQEIDESMSALDRSAEALRLKAFSAELRPHVRDYLVKRLAGFDSVDESDPLTYCSRLRNPAQFSGPSSQAPAVAVHR